MTDYNTMTAQQCADWLAERDGCKHEHGPYGGHWVKRAADGTILWAGDHPYPLTLDAAAAALRERWWVKVRKEPRFKTTPMWMVSAADTHADGGRGYNEVEAVAEDRLTAEYRAAVAARMEDER